MEEAAALPCQQPAPVLPLPGTHTGNLGVTAQPQRVPALAAPLHLESTDLAAPTGAQVPPGCPPEVQSAPAPQDPAATPPAPPCSTLGLIQQLPAIL